jgi:hypothetical protein
LSAAVRRPIRQDAKCQILTARLYGRPWRSTHIVRKLRPAFAATQYALLSSLYVLPGKFIGGLSSVMVDAFGYVKFFIATATIGIPVVVLTLVVWRLATREAAKQPT